MVEKVIIFVKYNIHSIHLANDRVYAIPHNPYIDDIT